MLVSIVYLDNPIIDIEELRYVFDVVLELRQRVRDWLFRIAPGEFSREIEG